MHAGKQYSFSEFFIWSGRETIKLVIIAVIPTILYTLLGWTWLGIPWVPIALIGTAAAFIIGFKNNATYNRLWEARQIWGSIVNSSRSWGIMCRDFIGASAVQTVTEAELKLIHQTLLYRHMAWLTALRYQLREPRAWENMNRNYNVEYRKKYFEVEELDSKLEDKLGKYLSAEEETYILGKKNRAAQIISLQSMHLKELAEKGLVTELKYIELENLLANLYEQQGKSERIKNFPYPRQFATLNLFFVRLFVVIVPLGILKEMEKMGSHMIWLTIPISLLVTWVFMAMEKIGESTENPFEGQANDVPITAMSRTIEIDLRDMLDEKDLPAQLQPQHNILM